MACNESIIKSYYRAAHHSAVKMQKARKVKIDMNPKKVQNQTEQYKRSPGKFDQKVSHYDFASGPGNRSCRRQFVVSTG